MQPLNAQLENIAQLCSQHENGIAGTRLIAQEIYAAANPYPETSAKAMRLLEGEVRKYEDKYRETGETNTTKWESALDLIVSLSCLRPNMEHADWGRTLPTIAFFASVHHRGHHEGFGKGRADEWKKEIAVVRPDFIKSLNRLIHQYCEIVTSSPPPVDEENYRSSGGGQIPQKKSLLENKR